MRVHSELLHILLIKNMWIFAAIYKKSQTLITPILLLQFVLLFKKIIERKRKNNNI